MTSYTGKDGSNDCIHVLFAANSTYIQHVAVAAVSLLENCSKGPVHLHLAASDLDTIELERLQSSIAPYEGVRLSVHEVDGKRVAGAHTDRYISRESYFRALAPEFLPAEITKVIYLDSDIVVLGDICDLYEVDLCGRSMAAAPDVDWREARDDGRLLALGLERAEIYFNAGVLVMDLKKWRELGLARRVLQYAEEMGSRLEYHDQDALNVVLKGDIAPLDRRWNVQALMYGRQFRTTLPKEYSATRMARARPSIIHYTTAAKPWKFRTYVPRKALYHRMRAKTAWRDKLPPFANSQQRMEHVLTLRLLRVGVDIAVFPRLAQTFGSVRRGVSVKP